MSEAADYRYPLSKKSLQVLQEMRHPPAPLTDAVLEGAGGSTEATGSVQVDATGQAAVNGTVAAGAAAEAGPLTEVEKKLLEGRVIAAVRSVYDPEIPINIYDLGLIYKIDVREDRSVKVTMTLTAPGCPVAGSLPAEVQGRIANIDEVKDAEVELVWDPPWDRSRMSEEAQLALGLM